MEFSLVCQAFPLIRLHIVGKALIWVGCNFFVKFPLIWGSLCVVPRHTPMLFLVEYPPPPGSRTRRSTAPEVCGLYNTANGCRFKKCKYVHRCSEPGCNSLHSRAIARGSSYYRHQCGTFTVNPTAHWGCRVQLWPKHCQLAVGT